jgi:choice-of-anchor B domain-containing protein
MKVSRILARPLLLCSLCLLLTLAWGSRSRLTAQQKDPLSDGAATTIAYMQRFLEDRQPAHDLEAMGATPCVGGFAGDYPCNNVDLLAFMPLATIGGGEGNDIWGWTDPLDGTEYAIMGRTTGTAFVDISDPENPIYLGNLPTHTSPSSWRDIKVYADHAFVVSEAGGHGMQVFDLTQLRDVVSPPVTFAETAHYPGFGNAHNVAINEDTGFAYAIGSSTCSGGLHMVNIQDPDNPTNAGCFSDDGYTHDTQCVIYTGPDTQHQGQEICFSSNEDTLTIVDVTDKSDPVQLSRTGYSGSGYTHQGWLTEDQVHFLMDDEADETSFGHNTRTRVWDVSDLDDPSVIDFYDAPVPSIDHNLYTLNNYVYEANYRSGLRILDGSDLMNMTEAGFFDVYPADDSPNFNGSWSVFPYYDSGVVVVSGIEQGLFVLQPILAPDFQMDAETNNFAVCVPDSVTTTLDITDRNGYTGTVTLSTADLPAGSTASFTTNPVVVPGSSDLTVTVSTTPAGTYPFDVVGSDGTITHTEPIILNVFDANPGVPTLLDPPNAATDVLPVPTFEWTAATQGYTYDLQVATDPGFTNVVYSATVNGTSHTMTDALEPETLYYWRVRSNNECGTGSYSPAFYFAVRAIPPILLVDDDDNSPDVQATYVAALNQFTESFDIWDTENSDNEPALTDLQGYDVVVWFTGDEFGGFAGPGGSGEAALGDWLDEGNCLFISSQDYHYDRGMTPFMSNYLGAGSITDDDGDYSSVTGEGSVFGGLGPYSLTYPFTDYSDPITPGGSAELAFDGNNGNGAGVNKDGGDYRTIFLVYPFEALSSQGRTDVLAATFDWFEACYSSEGGDLAIQKDQPEGVLAPGELITYTITLTNTGSITATGIVVTDTLNGNAVTVPGATTLNPGQTAEYTFSYEIQPADCTTGLDNLASATSAEGGSASTLLPVHSDLDCPTLSIAKSQPAGTLTPGQWITYTVTVTNNGSVEATGVVVTDTLNGNAVTLTGPGTIAGGTSADYEFAYQIQAADCQTGLSNMAEVISTEGAAASLADPIVTNLTCQADYLIYLPLIIKP